MEGQQGRSIKGKAAERKIAERESTQKSPGEKMWEPMFNLLKQLIVGAIKAHG